MKLGRLFGKPKIKQEHKVLRQLQARNEAVVPEYHRATPECRTPSAGACTTP